MRETRYLWVKNLPENILEDKVVDYFKRYGRIEKVKFIQKKHPDDVLSAIVAYVDIRSAQHAQGTLNTLGNKQLQITFSDPAAMSSTSNRRADQSPTQHGPTHRSYLSSSHRQDSSKTLDGLSGDRYRGVRSSPTVSKSSEHHEKTTHKRKNSKIRDVFNINPKMERKSNKIETVKLKKKHKGQIEDAKLNSRSNKSSKQKESASSKRKSINKKKKEASSSDDDDEEDDPDLEDDSSSSDSDDSSEQSSSDSTASSASSSSQSNSSDSSSSKSSIGSQLDGQKLVTIIIKKLPSRPSVNSLRDGIYHEFKKCGKVKSVVIRGDNNLRHALVLFRNAAEANKAISHAKTKLLFGAPIEASLYDGEVSGKELQECGGIIDEFHPRASRTLFVGNLDKTVQYSDIQNIFVRFGEIVAIEIKKMFNVPQYAFLQYTDIASVVKAIQKMDGELLGRNVLKLGFGKTVMSSCVWVEGVTDGFTEHYLATCFHKYGSVKRVIIDRSLGQALVFYPKYEHAQKAISILRGRTLNGSRLKLDYASHELVELFLSRMQSSGQTVTTFDSIRHLLLPTPSGPGMPSTNLVQGSRSGRSGSTHPYPSRPDPYYDDIHRYHAPPHGYESSIPPRGDWRGGYDDRSRNRPVYQNLSPRGRHYRDDRPDYFHRESDHFDRPPSRYDPDYRSADYIRRDHGHEFHSRSSYADDYHRSIKTRDHHESYHSHMTPPGRMLTRRSRSISPRISASGNRSREFEIKSEARLRDHSLSRGRSPIKSPGSKDGKLSTSDSWTTRKYRDHSSHGSPNLCIRRDDERRAELREPKSLPGSPRSTPSSVRSKIVHDSPDQRSGHNWPESGNSAVRVAKSGDSYTRSSWEMEYNRSRSETPTRDENIATIGEVIIKQPSASNTSHPNSSKHSDDEKPDSKHKNDLSTKKKKLKASHSSKDLEYSEDTSSSGDKCVLHRKYSSSSSSDQNKKHKTKQTKENDRTPKKYKIEKYSGSDCEKPAKKSKLSSAVKDEKKKKNSRISDSKLYQPEKFHCKPSALIKREYSPSPSLEENIEKSKKKERKSSKSNLTSEHHKHRTSEEKSRIRQDHSHSRDASLSDEDINDARFHRHRKYQQMLKDDADPSPVHNDYNSIEENSKLKRSYSGSHSDDQRSSKRPRKSSTKHEAPIPVASQSFMSGLDEESTASIDSDAKEPSSQFRPKLVVKEEVIEVESTEDLAESCSGDQVSTPGSVVNVKMENERRSRWEPAKSPVVRATPKVNIAQPFHTINQPYPSQLNVEQQLDVSDEVEVTDEKLPSDIAEGVDENSDSREKLLRLEKEKAKLQALLEKLDSKQELVEEEASEVANVFLSGVVNKAKLKLHTKKEKILDEEASFAESPKIEEAVIQEEVVEDKLIMEYEKDKDTVIEQDLEAPEIVEEQTIVEEVFSEDAIYADPQLFETERTLEKNLTSTSFSDFKPHSLEANKQDLNTENNVQVAKVISERKKEKYCRSLLKKQKREREKQKRKIDMMRGPSQSIVSSIVDDEYEATGDSTQKIHAGENINSNSDSTAKCLLADNNVSVPATTSVSFEHPRVALVVSNGDETYVDKILDDSRLKEVESSKESSNAFAKPFLKEASTPGSTPKSIKTETVSPSIQKTCENSRTSSSPFTPVTAVQAEKCSQSSGRSSTTLTPLTPSPKSKFQSKTELSSKLTSKQRNSRERKISSDHKRKKSESSKINQKDDSWKTKTPVQPKSFTNLTVSREADFSKPLDKKELERLCIEVAKVKKELELSQGSYTPSPDAESNIPPISPILKSPLENVTPDSYGKSGTSPIIHLSPSTMTSGAISSNLTERMKLLGKVKKKTRSEDGNRNHSEKHSPAVSRHDPIGSEIKFSNSRFFKSSIFDQDSQRLSHLQSSSSALPSSSNQPYIFSNFGTCELPEDRPLFSSIVEKAGALNVSTSASDPSLSKEFPKNEPSLSSDTTIPATAERRDSGWAGMHTNTIVAGADCKADNMEVNSQFVEKSDSAPNAESLSLLIKNESAISKKALEEIIVKEQACSSTKSNSSVKTSTGLNVPKVTIPSIQELPSPLNVVTSVNVIDHVKSDINEPYHSAKGDSRKLTCSPNIGITLATAECLHDKEVSLIKDDIVEEQANEIDESMKSSFGNMLATNDAALTSSQDSYIGGLNDIVTTEVITSDTDLCSAPEFVEDISLQEVVAEEDSEPDGDQIKVVSAITDNIASGEPSDLVPPNRTENKLESADLSNEPISALSPAKPDSPNTKTEASLTDQSMVQVQLTSSKEINTHKMKKSELQHSPARVARIAPINDSTEVIIAQISKTSSLKFTPEASVLKENIAKWEEKPKIDSHNLQVTQAVSVSDATKISSADMPIVHVSQYSENVEGFGKENQTKQKENQKTKLSPNRAASISDATKATNVENIKSNIFKPTSEFKEKKMVFEKKHKTEKIRKERRDDKKTASSKDNCMKPSKLSKPSSSIKQQTADKPDDKTSHKKLLKEDKTKSSSTSKIKPFDGKAEKDKSTEKLATISTDSKSIDERDSTKEFKPATKLGEDLRSLAGLEDVKAIKQSDYPTKSHKKIDKKLKVSNDSSEKKIKISKHESEKKKESKQKLSKDDKSFFSIHKKSKIDDPVKDKQKSSQISKKITDVKDRAKKKAFLKDSVPPLSNKDSKVKIKTKHPKNESSYEPAKKKARRDEEKETIKKSVHPTVLSSADSDNSDMSMHHVKLSRSEQKPAQVKSDTIKSKVKVTEQKSGIISSDSESSDNYDDFIHSLSGGNPMTEKKSLKPIYTSSDNSEQSEGETKKYSTKVKPAKQYKSDRYDSDKSEKSLKKFSQTKEKTKQKKLTDKITSGSEKLKTHEKLIKQTKLSEKDKKSARQTSDSHSPIIKKSSERKSTFSNSETDLSSEEGTGLFSVQGKNKTKVKKTHSSKNKSSLQFKNESQKSVTDHIRNEPTSSSSDSYDYRPQSPSSTSLLTVETKGETVISSDYILEPLDSSKRSKKPMNRSDMSEKAIYTSSSSCESDIEMPVKRHEITAEDRKKYFGSSDSSDESDESSTISSRAVATVKTQQPMKHKHSESMQSDESRIFKKEFTASHSSKSIEESSKSIKQLSKSVDHKKQMKSSKHQVLNKSKFSSETKQKSSSKKEDKTYSLLESKVVTEKTDASISKDKHQKPLFKSKQNDDNQRKQETKLSKHLDQQKEGKIPHDDKSSKDKVYRPHQIEKNKSEKIERNSKHDKPVSSETSVKDKEKSIKTESSHIKDIAKEKAKSSKESTQHSAKILKQKSKESSYSKLSKETQLVVDKKESKFSKDKKHHREHVKVKKEIKSLNSELKKDDNASASLSLKQSPTSELIKNDKEITHRVDKMSPKSDIEVYAPCINDELHVPSIQDDEKSNLKSKIDDSMPGRSFFYSSSSDDDYDDEKLKQLSIVSDQEKDTPPESNRGISFGLWKGMDENSEHSFDVSSTTIHKSMFSPTKDDEDLKSSSLAEEQKDASLVSFSSVSPFASDAKKWSEKKQIKDSESVQTTLAQESALTDKNKKDELKKSKANFSEKSKRLSSYEKFQLQQERHREHIKELKKQSQLRDEEAVRSIMEASSSHYFSSPPVGNKVDEEAQDIGGSFSTSISEESSEPLKHQPTHSDDVSSNEDSHQAHNATLEPRSVAEEDELAAALRSIEGFGDFDNSSKNDLNEPSRLYEPSSYAKSNQTESEETSQKIPPDKDNFINSEAESATSALIQESGMYTEAIDPSLDDSSTKQDKDDHQITIQLPSLCDDDGSSVSTTSISQLASATQSKEPPKEETQNISSNLEAKEAHQIKNYNSEKHQESPLAEETPSAATNLDKNILAPVEKSPQELSRSPLPSTASLSVTSLNVPPTSSFPSDGSVANSRPFVSLLRREVSSPPPSTTSAASISGLVVSQSLEVARSEKNQMSSSTRRLSLDLTPATLPPRTAAPPGGSNMHAKSHPKLSNYPNSNSSSISTASQFTNELKFHPYNPVTVASTKPLTTIPPTQSLHPMSHYMSLPPQLTVDPSIMLQTNPYFRQHALTHAPYEQHPSINKASTILPPPHTTLDFPPTGKDPSTDSRPIYHQPTSLNFSQTAYRPSQSTKVDVPQTTTVHVSIATGSNCHQLPVQTSPAVDHNVSHYSALPQPQPGRRELTKPYLPRIPCAGSDVSLASSAKQSPSTKENPRPEETQQTTATFTMPQFRHSGPGVSSHEQQMNIPSLPAQASVVHPQGLPQFSQSPMFLPQSQGLSMFALPGVHTSVPFRGPAFSGFTVPPMHNLPHSLSHQQLHSGYVFQPRPVARPLVSLSQARPIQTSSEADKAHQPTPARSIPNTMHTIPKDPDSLTKAHSMLRLPSHPHEQPVVRAPHHSLAEASARQSISMAGDSSTMVDHHFKLSGFPSSSQASIAMTQSAQPRPIITAHPLYRSPSKELPPSSHIPSSIPMRPSSIQTHPGSFQHHPPTHREASPQIPRMKIPADIPHYQSTPTKPDVDSYSLKAIGQQGSQPAASSHSHEQDFLQDLFQRYPVIWQGKLALKNISAAVQIHFVAGNVNIGQTCLPNHNDESGMAVLRIVQRMRTNTEQMRSFRERMTRDEDCCLLLALPCGRDKDDVTLQTDALRTGFIEYLQQKEVAGIVNVEKTTQSQNNITFVLHIFAPCEFTHSNLHSRAPDLLENVSDIHHLLIVVTPSTTPR